MADLKVEDALSIPGRFVRGPTDLTIAFPYGGTAFGADGKLTLERFGGYGPLIEAIVHFFKTGEAPVAEEETLEIYAFMQAADASKADGGRPVRLDEVLSDARVAAGEKLAEMIGDN